jgi:hypothetical protein
MAKLVAYELVHSGAHPDWARAHDPILSKLDLIEFAIVWNMAMFLDL